MTIRWAVVEHPPWAQTEGAKSRHAIKMAYIQLMHCGVNVQSRKETEIAGALCYTRSTCDDERELWALSHLYKASGQDRCHPEFLRDSVVVQRYGATEKSVVVGTGGVLTDECKALTEKWLQLFGPRFRVRSEPTKRKLSVQENGPCGPKTLRIRHSSALQRLISSELLPEHHTMFGKPLRTVTNVAVNVELNVQQTESVNKVRAKKSLVKRRQRVNLERTKSFRDEARNYRNKASQMVAALKTAGEAAKVDASNDFTVFLPKQHQCRQVPFHMKRADFWAADIFVVDNINCVTTAGYLDSTAMWAMVLGKRLATPSYLTSAKKERLSSSCSIKYKKAYTLKELGWWLTAEFTKKEKRLCETLTRACGQGDSKWRVLDQMTFDQWQRSKALAAKIYHVDSKRDLVNHIRKLAKVDRCATSRVVLANARSS